MYRLLFKVWRFQVDSGWHRTNYFAAFETALLLRADATITTRLQSVINHYQSGRGRKSGFRSLHRYQWL